MTMLPPRSPCASMPASILQLRSSAGLYGADRVVLALDAGLRRQGARSRLLSIRNYLMASQPLHEAAMDAGQDAVLLPCRGRIDMRTVAALVAQIDTCAADVLHVHDYKSAFYAWLATRRRPQVKLVATLHGWVEASQALRLYNTLEIALLRRFDTLVVVAAAQAERLLRAGVPAARIRQIDNGIALAASEPPSPALRTALGLDDAGLVFAAVARLSPEKNLSLLLDAFATVAAGDRRTMLLIVGDGPERQALEAQAGRLGLQDRVRFAGIRTDMAQVYPLIDCLVLPSLSEGMPLVVLEAMSRAIPVIASAVGEVPRLLANTRHGRLVPPGDEPALRAAMLAALAQPGCRDEPGAVFVQAQHSEDAMAGRYLGLYQSLMVDGHDRKTA
jgi:glycosyltransferase involved in cell wall biosynthesis